MAPSAAGASPDFDRVRALFERAMELPSEQREAFVRREAGDDAPLCERVLGMVRTAEDAKTADLHERLGDDFGRMPGGDGTGERVRSTATSELLARLEQAPRLDTNRYDVHGEVDRGGMGAIVGLSDRHLNRRLVMKVLLERDAPRDDYEQQLAHQILGRFLEEAQVTSQLDHPGVVPVHELGLDQAGRVYFTMRFVKGRTAQEVFRESHGGAADWPLTRALEIVLKVCDTVAFAHDKGVLHRDLKPGNVMVGRFGEVYVMDWGLAKVLGQEDRRDLRIRPEHVTPVSAADSARKRDATNTGTTAASAQATAWDLPGPPATASTAAAVTGSPRCGRGRPVAARRPSAAASSACAPPGSSRSDLTTSGEPSRVSSPICTRCSRTCSSTTFCCSAISGTSSKRPSVR